jgi:hypothetical protein
MQLKVRFLYFVKFSSYKNYRMKVNYLIEWSLGYMQGQTIKFQDCIHLRKTTFKIEHIVTYPGFAWLIRRVLDLTIEFIKPLYSWLQQFTNHYLTLSSSSGWTRHGNYSDFQLNWTVNSSQSHIATDGQSVSKSCLSFETSLFVASYDSQGHGGGIRPRLHTGELSIIVGFWLYSLG